MVNHLSIGEVWVRLLYLFFLVSVGELEAIISYQNVVGRLRARGLVLLWYLLFWREVSDARLQVVHYHFITRAHLVIFLGLVEGTVQAYLTIG